MAGKVATQLWQEWQSSETTADVFNVNVPLGFKTVDGTPVAPEVLRTTVDMQSQYSSLYSRCPLRCLLVCMLMTPLLPSNPFALRSQKFSPVYYIIWPA